MRTRPDHPKFLSKLTAVAGLAIWLALDPVQAFQSSGPGTQRYKPLHAWLIQDLDSRVNSFLFPNTMSPGVLQALGGCVDPEGNPPNSPIEYDMALRTDEDTSAAWRPGEVRALHLVLRSSSLRWVRTPPRIDMILIGGIGRDILIGGSGRDYLKSEGGLAGQKLTAITDGTSNTFFFTVPDVPAGLYQIYVFERTTGLCKASDFTFRIAGDGPQETPTPTPTPTGEVTPTPTITPAGPTPTRTLRMPDYDEPDGFVNAVDLPGFLTRLIMMSEEADLDGEDAETFRDVFMFSLWWQSDRLRGSE